MTKISFCLKLFKKNNMYCYYFEDPVKVKVLPVQATKVLRAGRGIALPNLRTLHWRWGWGVRNTSRRLHSRERPRIHWIGGWVGPRAGLDGCGKSRPPPGFNSRTVQPVASRYADWAIAATLDAVHLKKKRKDFHESRQINLLCVSYDTSSMKCVFFFFASRQCLQVNKFHCP